VTVPEAVGSSVSAELRTDMVPPLREPPASISLPPSMLPPLVAVSNPPVSRRLPLSRRLRMVVARCCTGSSWPGWS